VTTQPADLRVPVLHDAGCGICRRSARWRFARDAPVQPLHRNRTCQPGRSDVATAERRATFRLGQAVQGHLHKVDGIGRLGDQSHRRFARFLDQQLDGG